MWRKHHQDHKTNVPKKKKGKAANQKAIGKYFLRDKQK